MEVDILALARGCVGNSVFAKRVHPLSAPHEVNCSSLIKWLFGQRGIWLPRLSVQQRAMGSVVHAKEAQAGDLIFATAHFNLFTDDPDDGVGHVGLVTERWTVIHAKGRRSGVVEEDLGKFLAPGKFRGLRRLVAAGQRVDTLWIPPSEFIETSDDIRWLILQSHYRKRAVRIG
jgi:hypothetical protein